MATIDTNARPSGSFATRLLSFRRELTAELRRRRIYNNTHAQLSGLTDRELADIGLSRLQIADVARDAARHAR